MLKEIRDRRMTNNEKVQEMVWNGLVSRYHGEISKSRHDEFLKLLAAKHPDILQAYLWLIGAAPAHLENIGIGPRKFYFRGINKATGKCSCQKCNYVWSSLKLIITGNPPKECPSCKNRNWRKRRL